MCPWNTHVEAEQLPAHSLYDVAVGEEHQLKRPIFKNDWNWKASGVFVCLFKGQLEKQTSHQMVILDSGWTVWCAERTALAQLI